TGGLENLNTQDVAYENIHHHTGGLETKKNYQVRRQFHSPPHRWLRKL
ncbi:hypothetical protein BAZOLSSOX_304, partial [uncultured Gammaproteobacteria bacterium]